MVMLQRLLEQSSALRVRWLDATEIGRLCNREDEQAQVGANNGLRRGAVKKMGTKAKTRWRSQQINA